MFQGCFKHKKKWMFYGVSKVRKKGVSTVKIYVSTVFLG